MSASNYLENALLNHIFGKSTLSAPTIYIGLSTADPLDTGVGVAEPSGNNYSRKQTATSDWNTATTGSISNANEITFLTATGSWGTISHFFIADHPTAGNILLSGTINGGTPKAIDSNDQAKFAIGAFVVSVD